MGLGRPLFEGGSVSGGEFREDANKHLSALRGNEDSASAAHSEACSNVTHNTFIRRTFAAALCEAPLKVLSSAFPSQSERDTASSSRTIRRTESFHQQSHVKMLFMRALAVDWSSLLLQGYWVLQ